MREHPSFIAAGGLTSLEQGRQRGLDRDPRSQRLFADQPDQLAIVSEV